MKPKEAVSKGSLDTFHYSRTFYAVWFSSLPAASRFFSDEIRKNYRGNIDKHRFRIKPAYRQAGPE